MDRTLSHRICVLEISFGHLQEEDPHPAPEEGAQHQPCNAAQDVQCHNVHEDSMAHDSVAQNTDPHGENKLWLPKLTVGSARVAPLPTAAGTHSNAADADLAEAASSPRKQIHADSQRDLAQSIPLTSTLLTQSLSDLHGSQGLPETSLTEENVTMFTEQITGEQEIQAGEHGVSFDAVEQFPPAVTGLLMPSDHSDGVCYYG